MISLAAEAKIAKGDIDMGNRKMHWQDAHNSYQRALKLEPSNKDSVELKKLASMMDEQSISLAKVCSYSMTEIQHQQDLLPYL